MKDVGIYDGDIVIVEKTNTAKNGDIVVALTDDNEVTPKRFIKADISDFNRKWLMSPIILK